MIFNLVAILRDWLSAQGLYGLFRPFTYPEFRAILSILLGFVIVAAMGKRTIRWLLHMKIGDSAEFYHADLNQLTKQKKDTPTMGGLLIGAAILACVVLLADLGNYYVQMGLICLVWLLGIGVADDWLKLTTARRKPGSRQGLHTWEKLLLQCGLAVVLGLFIHSYAATKILPEVQQIDPEMEQIRIVSRSLNLPFFKTWTFADGQWQLSDTVRMLEMGAGVFALLAVIVIVGTSNAVNLSDGMDGLASGITAICAFAFMILAVIAGYVQPERDFVLAKYLLVPHIPGSEELAIFAGAMTGACLAFLWFNCYPAQVFMGDSGSLTLGGLLGFIAVVIRQEFLLLIVGAVFVAEALSVILQVGYFKASGGKRIFRCAPIHHHFHLGGWTEQQVVVRFWLITAVLAALAIATIKLR